jgi:hypothetical protein
MYRYCPGASQEAFVANAKKIDLPERRLGDFRQIDPMPRLHEAQPIRYKEMLGIFRWFFEKLDVSS